MHQARETTAGRVAGMLQEALGSPLPLRLRAWDGSEAGGSGPTLVVRRRRALRHLLWRPDELGLARAYVSGDLDVEGDMFAALAAFQQLRDAGARTPRAGRLDLLRQAAALGAVGPRPPLPAEELRRREGRLHSLGRDRAVVTHHYDVGNDFYRLVLGDTMVYSCAWFAGHTGEASGDVPPERPSDLAAPSEDELDRAQRAKLELVCRKLALRRDDRLLDVGCGWGSLVLHAAAEHGVRAVGITISPAQAELARRRVAAAGLADRVEIRVQDYREIDDGPYDAVASVGMAEHVGRDGLEPYAAHLRELLRPGGRLLNHMIATLEEQRPMHPFIDRYVFPDGELVRIGDAALALERGGLEVRDVHVLREHYALTLRAWVARLESRWDDAVAASSEGRARVWRLYMAASALSFQAGKLGVNQVLAVRPHPDGRSGMPLVLDR